MALSLAQQMLGNSAPEVLLSQNVVRAVINAEELLPLRQALEHLVVREELLTYVVDLVRQTRQHESILLGAGPRATQALLLASRAYAALAGRDFVTPDDVKTMAQPVLEHRLVLRPEFEIEGLTIPEVIRNILDARPVPQ